MNKQGEITITFGLILAIVLLGVSTLVLQADSKEKISLDTIKYIGDNSSKKITYHIYSINPNCDITKIDVSSENLVYFNNLKEVSENNFKVDNRCN